MSDFRFSVAMAFNAAVIAAVWAWLMPLPVIGLLWLMGVL